MRADSAYSPAVHGRLPWRAALAARWSRTAGRLGFDHNPLRRRTDRLESAIRLLAAAVMPIAVPAVGVAAGQAAEHRAVSQAAAPLGRNQVIGEVFFAVTLGMLAAAFALLAIAWLIRRALQRRRMDVWDAEWRAVAPRWTGYRS